MGTQVGSFPCSANGEETPIASTPMGFDWGFWNNTVHVGQPVVFNPTLTGGTPPYVFQWYTQKYNKQWGSPTEEEVLASTSSSSSSSTSFTFVSNNPGWYAISVRITDSLGYESDFSGMGVGIWVHVLENTSPTQASTHSAPIVVLLSPENTSYTAIYNPYVTLPLEFQTNNSLSWVGYSLDGGNNITVVNGTTIDITAESKSLTLYANDTAGNWASPQTVYYEIAFNLGTPPQSFPIVLVTVSLMITAFIIIFSLLLYSKKRKRNS
jgi:hypothetical protein